MTPPGINRKQTLLWAGVGAAIVGLLWLLGPTLSPFMLGLVLAYIFEPLVERLSRQRVPRTLAVVLVILFVISLVVGLILILVPVIQQEVRTLIARLPAYLTAAHEKLVPWLQQHFGITLQLDVDSLKRFIAKNWSSAQDYLMVALEYVSSQGAVIVGVVANVLLTPVVMFYLMRDWRDLRHRVAKLVPRPWLNRTLSLVDEIDAVLAEFLRGQLSVMAALALFYSVGLWIAGVDYALPLGLLSGLLGFIPYVGFSTGLLLSLLVATLQFQGWPPVIGVAIVYSLGQLLESFLLTPWLVGERIGLHPLAVIFALMAFGQLFGFVGVLIALPASAALLVGLREVRRHYLASHFYQGDAPKIIE
ncbi:MAG: AI-2E family transporter [Methyloversatilis discipulorum]|uniref:AI-2E family transporter n=1 Tax=Methyloversatilis discipulorum TaxID=1119528 RepID=UPI0026F1061C|nr:AI-2E family transporter [Methyloversatilis discipulorum]MBV5285699.1 AI-2E family transporter [Methyloversatilis discipulorum]